MLDVPVKTRPFTRQRLPRCSVTSPDTLLFLIFHLLSICIICEELFTCPVPSKILLLRIRFATLYNYLRSLFHVWKPIPFEESLWRGSASLPHINTLYLGSISRSHVLLPMLLLGATLFNVAGRWATIQRKKKIKKKCLPSDLWSVWNLIFPSFPQQCHHTQQTPLVQIAQTSLKTASSASQFTLWLRERGVVVVVGGCDVCLFSWNLLLVTWHP